jgi:hypothetical protein
MRWPIEWRAIKVRWARRRAACRVADCCGTRDLAQLRPRQPFAPARLEGFTAVRTCMTNVVYLFSRQIVSAFLESRTAVKSKNFEFMAALLMQRICEQRWNACTMIGFYLNQKYALLLKSNESPSIDLLKNALENGIAEDNPIDFIICTDCEHERSFQEFQLKRFGMKGQQTDTEGLINLNEMKRHYAATDTACLVALPDFSSIDFPSVRTEVNIKLPKDKMRARDPQTFQREARQPRVVGRVGCC